MKRIFAAMLAGMMLLSACGQKSTPTVAKPSQSAEQPAESVEQTGESSSGEAEIPYYIPHEIIYEPLDTSMYSAFLNKLGGDNNFAYAPESLNTALYMYGLCLNDSDEKSQIETLTGGRNYLFYQSTDAYKLINRVWFDLDRQEKGLYDFSSVPAVEHFLYGVEMAAPDATQIKDDYVSDQTDGFITSTPTKFTKDTALDFMNVAYFNAVWDKDANDFEVKDENFRFYNIHGEYDETESIGFSGSRYYYENDEAYACELYYDSPKDNPYKMILILPKEPSYEGVYFVRRPLPINPSIAVSDISSLIPDENGIIQAEQKHADIFRLEMPRISVKCDWQLQPGDEETLKILGIPDFGTGNFDRSIYSVPTDSSITQVVRVESDENGTKAAAVTEVMQNDVTAIADPKPLTEFNFTCDRPFLYVIYDTVNRDVAFVGQVCSIEGTTLTDDCSCGCSGNHEDGSCKCNH